MTEGSLHSYYQWGGTSNVGQAQVAQDLPLFSASELIHLFLTRTANRSFSIDENGVHAVSVQPALFFSLPYLFRGQLPPVRNHYRLRLLLGRSHGLALAALVRNQAKWFLDGLIRMYVNRSVEAIINLPSVMGVVKITPILCRAPFIEKVITRRNGFLRKARRAVRPGSAMLFDPWGIMSLIALEPSEEGPTVEVNGCISGQIVDHQELDIVSLSQLEQRTGELTVSKDHLSRDARWGPFFPGKCEIESHRVSGGAHMVVRPVSPGE